MKPPIETDTRAPFPYAGGKGRIEVLETCWAAMGHDVPTYIEPFVGSAAMLLGRPGGAGKYEVVGDANALIANVWRAVSYDPMLTAHFCDNPPAETDLLAWARLLRERLPGLEERLQNDPFAHDPMLAGRWIWCQSVSFSPDWLKQKNPPLAKPYRRGILSPSIEPIELISALSVRLRRVSIACGSWEKLVTPSALGFHNTGTTPTAIFFDPPYPEENLDYGAEPDTAKNVETWCRENGDDKRLRIVLCGHVGDYDLPGWRVVNWGGSRGWGRSKRGKNEAVWLSPHCLTREETQGALFDFDSQESRKSA